MSIFVVLAMCVILRKFFPKTRLINIHVYFLIFLKFFSCFKYMYMCIYFINNILIHVGLIFVFCNFVYG